MAVKKPTKVLGRSIALKFAQKRMQARSSRMAWATLNLTAMVDMFTLLVVFLLANFSATGEVLFMSKEISLPKAEATSQLDRHPVISISSGAIALEGKRVLFTEEATRPDVADLPELTENLRDIRRADEAMHPGQFKGTVILQSDQNVPFSVVRKVMYAAAQAGYIDMNYAVLSKRGTIGDTVAN